MTIEDIKTEFKKYPEYQVSGVKWLGEIPKGWTLRRFKYLFKEINERSNEGNEDLLSVSQYTGVTKKSDKVNDGNLLTTASTLEGYKKVYKNDLVSNIMLAWNGSLGFSPFNGITSPAYSIYRLNKGNNERYFHYLVRTEIYKAEFKRNSSGVIESRLRLYTDDFFNIWSILPSLEEQTAIANFLDKKCGKIDQAISQKQKLIKLLKERKQILIQNAVTKGLDPNAKMKDSGVDWIGEIPMNWEVKRLKYLAEIRYGLGQPPKEKEGGLPIIRATNVERGLIVEKGLIYVDPEDIPWDRNPELKENDIIVVRSGAYTGDSAIVTKKYANTIAGYDMVMTPKNVNATFLSYSMLASYVLFEQLYLQRMRAAQPHLNAEELGETLIIIPQDNEQKQIVNHIETQSIKIDKAIALQQQQIEKLKEYKASVINSAVTGKIKVC